VNADERLTQVLADFSQRLLGDYAVDDALQQVAEAAVDVLPVEVAGVSLADRQDQLRFAATSHVSTDLYDEAIRHLERAVSELGRLDVLVNSASLFESSALLDVDAEAWDRVMAVNLRAPFLLTRAAAPYLTEAKGVIINIADLSGLRVWRAFPHHGIAKAGLIHLTRVAARSLGPLVRVNCVVPGTVLPPDDYTEEQIAASVDRTVLKRVGSPRDVEEAMLFLIRSDFATGSIVVVDGGRMLR
jgi:NAD(P)-dependent dehydrogenase (short-subunit alcohol dehydrogenase family)